MVITLAPTSQLLAQAPPRHWASVKLGKVLIAAGARRGRSPVGVRDELALIDRLPPPSALIHRWLFVVGG
jgi:hypothetical protein